MSHYHGSKISKFPDFTRLLYGVPEQKNYFPFINLNTLLLDSNPETFANI